MKYKLKEKKKIHPEQLDGEVFICFETKESFKEVSWTTKRLGKQGYDLIEMYREKLIPIKGIFLMFIKKQEITDYRESKFTEKEKNNE